MKWHDIETIAESLELKHSSEILNEIDYNDLYELIIHLDDFDDKEDMYDEEIYEEILLHWEELRQLND